MQYIYCLNPYPRPQSRTETLIQTLNELQLPYKYLQVDKRLADNKLFKRLLPKNLRNPYHSRLINGSALFLSVLPSIIWKALLLNYKCSVIICFECWELYNIVRMLSQMRNVTVVVDLGYPVRDVSAVNLPEWYKPKIAKLEKILDRRNVSLLLESHQQVMLATANLSKAQAYTFFVTESVGLSHKLIVDSSGVPERIKNLESYILFRGTLNDESGILDIIQSFIKFSEENLGFSSNLLIHGRGALQTDVQELAKSSDRIHYISDYLNVEQLTFMMAKATAIIGQFNLLSERPYFTLPHKFIEALKLRKPYITPYRPPLEPYLRALLTYQQLQMIRQSSDPFYSWLSMLFDYSSTLNNNDIISVSKAILTEMHSTSKNSLIAAINSLQYL